MEVLSGDVLDPLIVLFLCDLMESEDSFLSSLCLSPEILTSFDKVLPSCFFIKDPDFSLVATSFWCVHPTPL
jgi:hypothetical protein